MKKRIYVISCILFLLFIAINIPNDKYSREFLVQNMEFINMTESVNDISAIVGTGQNSCIFAKTPNVNLPKGKYIITIKYATDTDGNTVIIDGNRTEQNIILDEQDNALQTTVKNADDVIEMKNADRFITSKSLPITILENTRKINIQVNFTGKGTLIIKSIKLESTNIAFTDSVAILILFAILFLVVGRMAYYRPSNEKQKKLIVFLILLTITIIVSYPMFNNYIMMAHDIGFHATRIEGIKSALLSGQFPVRIHSSTEDNYGYGAAMFYPELFLYFPALLRILGVSLTTTLQIFVIVINFVTAYIMYFTMFKLSKVRTIAILGSILYVFANYRLCDLYTRFALGELLAIAFLPLVVYGVYELLCGDYTKWKYAVIGVSCVLQSHIITTIYMTLSIALLTILSVRVFKDKRRVFACIKAIIITILINLWFIIPLVMMMQEDINTSALVRDVPNYTIYVNQLFWNLNSAGEMRNIIGQDMQNVMPLSIGITIILGTLLFGYCIITKKLEDRKEKTPLVIMTIFGIFFALGSTNLFPWEMIIKIPLIGTVAEMIQFPWRLLMFTVLFLSVPSAYGIFYTLSGVEVRKALVIGTFVLSALIGANYMENYCLEEIYCYKGEIVSGLSVGDGEYFYRGTSTKKLKKRSEKIVASSEKTIISDFKRYNSKISVKINNEENETQYIEVPLSYYPGYNAFADDSTLLSVEKGDNNVVRVILPSGFNATITIKYIERKLWRLFDIISAIASIIFMLSFFRKRSKKVTMKPKAE